MATAGRTNYTGGITTGADAIFTKTVSDRQFRLEAGGAWILGTNGDRGWVLLTSDDYHEKTVLGFMSEQAAKMSAISLLRTILTDGLRQLMNVEM